MQLTTANEELIRAPDHRTKLWLSIYNPDVVLACQVNDASIAKGEREITYNNVTAGIWSNIASGYLLLVGSTAGARDYGVVRIKSASSSVLTVAENSHINWADDLYLTVLKFIQIDAIYPRIISDPANAEDVIFYKDYDIAYTDQNSVLGTLTCAGPHRAGFIGDSFYWSSSGSFNVNEENLTFAWTFEGGVPSTSSARDPGYVSYPTGGHFQTRLIVSNASGGDDYTYRYVSIYDRPENGTNTPILQWELQSIAGSRGEGGYTAKIIIHEQINLVQPNSLVVIFADDWYGDTEISLGGNSENNSSIVFVGYILQDTIRYDYRTNQAEFEVGTVNRIMQEAEGFSISCESVSSPSKWYEIQDMKVPKAIYHYLSQHSTVLKVADFQYTGGNLRHQYFDADRSSLYDAINSFLDSGIKGELVSDRQGKLWAEVSAGAVPSAESAISLAMTLSKRDWMGEPVIDRRETKDLSYLEYGGIQYAGPASNNFSALMADAPGSAPAYRGKVERSQGLILTSQAQLNALVGDVFAYQNSPYKSINHVLKGNYRNLDIAPIERVLENIEATDTNAGIVLTNSPFHIISMDWIYDAKNQYFAPNITLAQVINGTDGDTISIPATPDDGGYNSGYNVPSFSIPNLNSLSTVTRRLKTYTWIIDVPIVGGIPGPKLNDLNNLVSVDAYIVGGSFADINIESRLLPANPGTDLLTSELVLTPTGVQTTSFTSISAGPGVWLWLDISSTVGIVAKAVVTLTTWVY